MVGLGWFYARTDRHRMVESARTILGAATFGCPWGAACKGGSVVHRGALEPLCCTIDGKFPMAEARGGI